MVAGLTAGAFTHQDERGLLFIDNEEAGPASPEVFALGEAPTIEFANGAYTLIREPFQYASARRSPLRDTRPQRQRFIGGTPDGGSNNPTNAASPGAPAGVGSESANQLAAPNQPQGTNGGSAGLGQQTPGGSASGANGLQSISPIESRPAPFGGIIQPVLADPDAPITPVDPEAPLTPVDPNSPVVPAVPEPASWLLMILGVAALGGALRMRRRQYATATSTAFSAS